MPSISAQLASRIGQAREDAKDFRETAEKLLIDIAGLCVAARKSDYVLAALKSWESGGFAVFRRSSPLYWPAGPWRRSAPFQVLDRLLLFGLVLFHCGLLAA